MQSSDLGASSAEQFLRREAKSAFQQKRAESATPNRIATWYRRVAVAAQRLSETSQK
jgi:hypothetical protein